MEESLLSSQRQEEQEDEPATTTTNHERIVDGLPYKTSLLIKSMYFLDALGSSTWGRFSAIYYNIHGLHPQQIGLIEGLRTAIPTVSMLFWGFVADVCHCRKIVWLLNKTASTIILLLLALPFVFRSYKHIFIVSIMTKVFVSNGILDAHVLELLGDANKMYYGRYRLYASLSWGIGSIIMGYITDHYGFDPNFIMFGGLSAIMIVLIATQIPEKRTTASTIDTDTDTATTTNDSTYPQQQDPRLEQPLIPLEHSNNNENNDLTDQNNNSNDDYTNNAHGGTTSTAVETTTTTTTTISSTIVSTTSTTVVKKRMIELLRLLLRPRVLIFLIEVIIMGAAMATVERLLFLYLVNDLQASTLLCGLSVGINVIFELPIFWYAETLLRVLGHYDGMFLCSMFCFSLRVFGYTWLTPDTRWYILLLEILHGITFACFWTVATDVSKVLISQTSDSYWSTAIPSIVQLLYSAIGVSIGSVLGGWMMHHLGSREMYRIMATIVSFMFVVHFIAAISTRVYHYYYCKNNHDTERLRTARRGAATASFLPNYQQEQQQEERESLSSSSINITLNHPNNNNDIGESNNDNETRL